MVCRGHHLRKLRYQRHSTALLLQGTQNDQLSDAQSNYDAAMRDAATNANLTAQIQSVKDQISQNKIEALQAQVSQLQLQNAMCGVVKFPTSYAFAGGNFPPVTTTTA